MKKLVLLVLGVVMAFGCGFYYGERTSNADWLRRTVTGIAVDCYNSDGKLVEDTWGKQFGAVTVACAPGQTATAKGAWKAVPERH